MQTQIRLYTIADRQAVIELFRLNVPRYFSAAEEKDLEHYLDHESDGYYLMELNGSIVGCGGINFLHNSTEGRISWDFFNPASRGQGLGTALLQHRLHRIKQINSVKTIVVRTSQHAFDFYRKNGFEIKEIVKDYWDKGFDLYRMELKTN